MTFKNYLDQLKQFAKDNPKSLDLEVVYAGDNEGNSYNKVYYSPSIGNIDGNEYQMHKEAKALPINAVCIN